MPNQTNRPTDDVPSRQDTVDRGRRLLVFALICISFTACSSFRNRASEDYTTISADSADTKRARALNTKGVEHQRKGHFDKAERHYRDALIADVNFGPAHNNLGQLYLAQRQLYLAAWEFELAANTMPHRIEPHLNLGLVYELAQRFEQAEESYRLAYSQNSQSAQSISHLVRLLVRREGDKSEVNHLLHELLFYDDRPQWRRWAEELLATRYRDEECCVDHTMGDGMETMSEQVPADLLRLPEVIPAPIPHSDVDSAEEILPAPESSLLQLAPPIDLGFDGKGSGVIQASAMEVRAGFGMIESESMVNTSMLFPSPPVLSSMPSEIPLAPAMRLSSENQASSPIVNGN